MRRASVDVMCTLPARGAVCAAVPRQAAARRGNGAPAFEMPAGLAARRRASAHTLTACEHHVCCDLQYDLYTTSYSPDGRVFQVEYAAKAVESSGTAVGVRCKDGVVMGFEKLVVSKMLVEVRACVPLCPLPVAAVWRRWLRVFPLRCRCTPHPPSVRQGSSRRIFTVSEHVGLAVCGLLADGRQLVNRARDEAAAYVEFYGSPIPGKVLAERLAGFVHAYTMYWSVRPFGASVLIAGKDSGNVRTRKANMSTRTPLPLRLKARQRGASEWTSRADRVLLPQMGRSCGWWSPRG